MQWLDVKHRGAQSPDKHDVSISVPIAEMVKTQIYSTTAGAMIFVHQAGLAFLLVTLTLWFQSAGIGGLTTWARRALEGDISKLGPLRSADLLVRFTTAVVALHALEILLWASCYRWFCFSSWESAFYFSATSYSTVGYGDITLPLKWRMLGPIESIMGVLMCGISVSLLFAIAVRLIGPERRL